VRIAAHVSPMLQIVVVREEEVPLYLAGQPVESLTETQVFEPAQADNAQPPGEAEEPGEAVE